MGRVGDGEEFVGTGLLEFRHVVTDSLDLLTVDSCLADPMSAPKAAASFDRGVDIYVI